MSSASFDRQVRATTTGRLPRLAHAGPSSLLLVPQRTRGGAGPRLSAHVLIVDSDSAASASLATRIYRRGHGVAIVIGVREAAAALAVARFDLVIVDPSREETAALGWIERLLRSPETPVVAIATRIPTLPLAIHAANLPLDGLFVKPLCDETLSKLLTHAASRAH